MVVLYHPFDVTHGRFITRQFLRGVRRRVERGRAGRWVFEYVTSGAACLTISFSSTDETNVAALTIEQTAFSVKLISLYSIFHIMWNSSFGRESEVIFLYHIL